MGSPASRAPRRVACLIAAIAAACVPATGAIAADYPGYPCSTYPSYPGCPQATPPVTTPPPETTPPGETPPTTTPPTTPPVTTPPVTPPRPRISGRSSLGTLTVAADGTVTLPGVVVVCPAGETVTCAVSASATAPAAAASRTHERRPVIVARARFRLKPGRSSAIRLKLTAAGHRLLARRRIVAATGRIVVTGAAGRKATKVVHLKLRPRRARARR